MSCSLRGRDTEPSRIKILTEIFDHFQQQTQWMITHPESVVEYHCKAESLIALLEEIDCGSVGGFDNDSPAPGACDYDLFDRFLGLIKKYKNENDVKLDTFPGLRPGHLAAYFNVINGMRDKMFESVDGKLAKS